MAKSKRWLLKREIAHAYRNVSRAMLHLAALESKFSPTHDDYGKYLQVMIVNLDVIRDAIKDFCTRAWGSYPEKWESWRNVGNPREGEEYD